MKYPAIPALLALLVGIAGTTSAQPMPSTPPVLLAAGDLADCGPGAALTEKLLARRPGLILAIGDLAYPNGSHADFQRCFTSTRGLAERPLTVHCGRHCQQTHRPVMAESSY